MISFLASSMYYNEPEEVINFQEILLYVATATVVVGATVGLSSSFQTKGRKSKSPPRVSSWPFVGSAFEFGADCRSFLKKHFCKLKSPIFTATIMGKDFHFVDTSYANFSPEKLFRSSALSFRPMANEALIHGFGIRATLVNTHNGKDGTGKEVNSLYCSHMMKAAGLSDLLAQAYVQFERIVFSDNDLYPSAADSQKSPFIKPLFWLVRESLFRATIGSAISESIVAPDNASTCLEQFGDFDEKFPLLIAKLPTWMFPKAVKGRQGIIDRCQGEEFYNGLSKMIREKNELIAQERFGITDKQDIALLTTVLVWAATANTMPAGFWLIYNLLKHKETAYVAIRKEIREFYQNRKRTSHRDDGPLTVAELDTLTGLDSALMESFRIYSESMIARDVMEDFELDLKISSSEKDDNKNSTHKYFLKKGSRLAVMMSCLHMDDAVFGANAHTFQWDRFLPDPKTGKVPKFTKNGKNIATPVRPFGGGDTICPGRKFASYEIKAFAVELLKRYDLELVEQGEETLKIDPSRVGLGINVPLGDVNVRISKSPIL